MRKLEKISLNRFIEDTKLTKKDYENYNIPKRSTTHSAGYDFEILKDFTIKPDEEIIIPTGIKVDMNEDEVLFLFIRSSLGFKYNIRLCNQVGVIDKDYYNNIDNEGHIFVKIKNEGTQEKKFKKKEKLVQGVFIKYLTTDNEQKILTTRKGGVGSTNKEGI